MRSRIPLLLLLLWPIVLWASGACADPQLWGKSNALRVQFSEERVASHFSHEWQGYLGQLELNEREFFWFAGNVERAQRAAAHEARKQKLRTWGWWLLTAGMEIWAYGEIQDQNECRLSGQIVYGVGTILWLVRAFMSEKAAPAQAALEAAEVYNSSLP